jgi:asparagine synthase (glutamine-hydrolysing)
MAAEPKRAWVVSIRPDAAPSFELPPAGAGRLPLSFADSGGFRCVSSGYLLTGVEMAEELATEPGSDARIILEAYRRWGEGVLDRLDGCCAFALWDPETRTLLCARDVIGRHPLFFAEPGGGLVVSWDPERVRQSPGVSRDLNPIVFAEELVSRFTNAEETHYRAVRRLRPGFALRWRNGRVENFRFWDPCPVGVPIRWVTRDEIEEFPRLFERAVERTTRFGQVGILLSGGFDSVSVAAWAAEIARERGTPGPRAYSLLFEDGLSEEAVQRGVAQALRLPQTWARLNDSLQGDGILARVLEQGVHYAWPPLNQFGPAYLALLQRAREEGCEMVLTGEGGDEWLGVTPGYAADLIRAGDLAGLARLTQAQIRSWNLFPPAVIYNVVWTLGLRVVLRDWIWRHAPALARLRRRQLTPRALPPWLAPDPSLRREMLARLDNWNCAVRQDSFYLAETRELLSHSLCALFLEEMFFRDTLAGVYTLHPYLDRSLVGFLLRTPPELLNAGGRTKALVRQALARRFPQLGFERQRKLLATEWNLAVCRSEGPPLWERLGRARVLAALGVVEPQRYHAMLEECPRSNSLSVVHRVFHGANLEAWARSRQS